MFFDAIIAWEGDPGFSLAGGAGIFCWCIYARILV